MSYPENPTLETLLHEQDWVLGLAKKLSRDSAAAADLAQEAWLAALQNPPRDLSRPRAWLRAVVLRLARGGWHAEQARKRREADHQDAGALYDAPQAVERAEQLKLLVSAVLQLEEPFSSTLLLRFFDNLEPAAIAARQGIPASTVRSRLSRGLAKLREALPADEFAEQSTGFRSLGWLAVLGLWSKARQSAPLKLAAMLVLTFSAAIYVQRHFESATPPAGSLELQGTSKTASLFEQLELGALQGASTQRARTALLASPSIPSIRGSLIASDGTPLVGIPLSLRIGREARAPAPPVPSGGFILSSKSSAPAGPLQELLRVESTKNGAFVFEDARLDEWFERKDLRVHFESAGYELLDEPVVRNKSLRLRPRLWMELRGVVRDAQSGSPIAGVQIFKGSYREATRSARDGSFSYPAMAARSDIRLTLQHPDYGILKRSVDLKDPFKLPIEFEMARGTQLRLQLLDRSDGTLIPGGRLCQGDIADPVEADNSTGLIAARCPSRERLNWTFAAPGYGFSRWSVRSEELGAGGLIQIPMEPIRKARGTLRDHFGAAAVGASLTASPWIPVGGFQSPGLKGTLSFYLLDPNIPLTPFDTPPESCDGQGEIEVAFLASDLPLRLSANNKTHWSYFKLDSLEDGFDFRMQARMQASGLHGQLQRHGSALGKYRELSLKLGEHLRTIDWDAEGNFGAKDLRPGTYDLNLAGVILKKDLLLEHGVDLDLGTIAVDSFIDVRLNVIDATGQPAAKLTLHAYPIELDTEAFSPKSPWARGSGITLTTDAKGSVLGLLPSAGKYGFFFDYGDSVTLMIRDGEKHTLQLSSTRRVHMQLVETSTQELLQNRFESRYLLSWRRPGELRTHYVPIDRKQPGLLVAELPVEEVELILRPWMWGMRTRSVLIPADVQTSRRNPLRVELEAGFKLEVRIVASAGKQGDPIASLWKDAEGQNLTYYFLHESEFDAIRQPLSDEEARQLKGSGEPLHFTDMGIYTQQLFFGGSSNSAEISGLLAGKYTIVAVNERGRRVPPPFKPRFFSVDESMDFVELQHAED